MRHIDFIVHAQNCAFVEFVGKVNKVELKVQNTQNLIHQKTTALLIRTSFNADAHAHAHSSTAKFTTLLKHLSFNQV